MSTLLQLSTHFVTSYTDFQAYPSNLIHKCIYPTTIKALKSRLDRAERKLLSSGPIGLDVPFRDWNDIDQKFARKHVRSDDELKTWLGDQSTVDPLDSTKLVGNLATKKDPKCRFIFIYAEHSQARLKLTRDMLVRILSYHQVMPGFLEFLFIFGSQFERRNLRFTGFDEQITLSAAHPGTAITDMGRSGQQYQLCYNLKSVACISDALTTASQKEWSIRPAAFCHQFDVQTGATLWISTKGRLEDLKEGIQDLTGKEGNVEGRSYGTPAKCFRSSFAVHLLYCHWSIGEWRWYIQWLEDMVEEQTSNAVIGSRNPGLGHARKEYVPDDLTNVQFYEDKINEAIMIMNANVHIMTSLKQFYEKLRQSPAFPDSLKLMHDNYFPTFAGQIDHMVYDSKMQIDRAELLVKIAADRKSLVLQHLQSQATEKMELMTSETHKEAIVMKVITVVTLVYLPATFVSTLFSTDIVKYQGAGSGSFSLVALERWLQVTIPLTAITLTIGYIAFKINDKKRKRDWLPFYN